ncbi:MAG: hypothetical protein EVJ48_09930 [Candidatus Acidulodesulfobacterium acidiphilum]|uniref:Uncharacterized protein n=1 Tax=Candidatus Acidulodesulfobacterium acidiphilum TaxID=2597224 RepID=A0A520X6L2_9DELT|nr:MAG: hypothetical protein EVJ48_09930 [Candidatus Acidulodesulfobacterium acidiphilum]
MVFKVCSDKNVYYRIEILWPELLFVMISLNDFVKLYALKKSKMRYDAMLYKENIWDSAIGKTVRCEAIYLILIRLFGGINSE